ncbi:MAG TPA: ABC transporter transmembrane domain-containing protein, partial [Steroidobacteraceae bacterium]|nr:ABC transporter transmembrane domain-containing protein [Steroidobacteraceae bacterium]
MPDLSELPGEIIERGRSRSLRPLRALMPFLARYRLIAVAALVALLVAAAALLILPLQLRNLTDHGLKADSAGLINRYFMGFLVAGAVFGIFAALRFYLVTWIGERVVADLREAVYRRVVRMDPAFFELTRTGEVMSRLTADTTLVQAIAGVNLSITLRSAINLVGGLAMLWATSIRLTGVILVLVPVVIGPMIWFGRQVRRLSRLAQDRVADTSSLVDETLNAIQTVQAFTLEELQSRRYGEAVERSFIAAIVRTRVRAVLIAVGTMLAFAAIVFVIWLGARAVYSHAMSQGQLYQFLVYAVIVAFSATSLTEMWGEVQRAAGAMERLAELLSAEPSIQAPALPARLPARSRGRISFEHVHFRYSSRPESYALHDFSLEVHSGETIAIVGPSGAGKSTSLQLLLRFYDPERGRICVDGLDIATLDPQELRRQIGLVPQETMLFGASARENIGYGRPGASHAEIEAAARAAAAEEFLRALPEGYDTFLGERGTRLSGGQRQRIAIARAILKDPPILLLDEATSALDAESERLVQAALARLMRGRTTLVIAHRLATVLKADRIVVLEAGRIIAVGSHSELLRASP